VLAAVLQRTGFDLVIAGNQSTDGSGGVVPSMIAEILDVPSATYLN
jgi:electron transfer flavoprotein beta subunit